MNKNSPFKMVYRLGLLILALFGAFSAHAQTHTYTDIGGIFFNNNTAACSSPMIRNIPVADSFNIVDTKLGFNATHTYRGDIRVVVEHPDGTRVTVINERGDSTDNYDVELSDDSTNPLDDNINDNTASPYYDRTASPVNPLSAFDGKNSAGTWKIEICDAFNGDNGTYNRSQLILEENVPTPGAPICGIRSDMLNNWTTGTFNYTENNIDGSGVNLSAAVTGETGRLATIAGGAFGGVSGLNLRSNGFLGSGATFTYSFSQNLASVNFDIGHVNRTDPGGLGGDSYTITARDSLGNTVYPNFTTSGSSYTANAATGFVDAIGSAPAILGISFTDPDLISQVIINWNDCTNCNNSFHGGAFSEMDLCLPALTPKISLLKSVKTLQDPINGTTNPKAIPGALAEYSIEAKNTGNAATDNNTTILTDVIPANTALYVGDISGSGTGPIRFIDGTPPSGLAYTFTSLASSTDNMSFSNNNGASFNYTPTADAEGVDTSVTNIRMSPAGQFSASSGAGDPSFKLLFRVKVQ